MAENTFKLGDVVRLKSGGPSMTVTYVDGSSGAVTCHWFPENKSEKAAWQEFPPAALERA